MSCPSCCTDEPDGIESFAESVLARELVAPSYGWFTEGFGTQDLVEARILLEREATEDAHA